MVAKDDEQSGFAPVEETDWWFEAMRLGAAQKQSKGAGVTIGLLEDSLDTSVPELRGQDIQMRHSCSYEHPDSRPLKGHPNAEHGTAMAALLVGNGKGTDNGSGIRGVSPEASVNLYATDHTPADETEMACLEAGMGLLLQSAVKDEVDILNMSFGAGPSTFDIPPGQDGSQDSGSLKPVMEAGAVVVASTAPKGEPVNHPADISGVVSVVAVDEDAQLWSEMQRSATNVIAAPGVRVGTGSMTESGWRSDGWHDGSSVATAVVSGALALVKSKYPEATGNQLIQHMIHNPGGERGYGWSSDYGFGIISVSNMLESDPTQWPDENPLLEGPRAAVKAYPMWSSSEIEAPAGVDDKWARAERAGSEEDSEGASGKTAADGAVDDAAASESSGSGMPAWGWAGLGVAVVVLLAAGLVLGRLRTRRAT